MLGRRPDRRYPLCPLPMPAPALSKTLVLAALGLVACGRPATHYAVDSAMTSAYRADPGARYDVGEGRRYQLLAGDMHCHVSPPDHPSEASRSPEETVRLAAEEGLDFVVLTPHVRARFFQDAGERDGVVRALARLRDAIDEAAERDGQGRTTFAYGFEYTDHSYGHLGVAFANLESVFAAVPAAMLRREPARFFEEYAARGGLLIINHPLVLPLDSFISIARANLSWRPFVAGDHGTFPAEIMAATRLAHGIEAYNLTVTHLRDRYLLGDTDRTLLETLRLMDHQILLQGRRMIPTGGTDSHSDHLRSVLFVLSEGRTQAAIRDAIAAGRVCIRAPEACSLEVRPAGGEGAWAGVGESLQGVHTVEARADGGPIQILVNGKVAEEPEPRQTVRIPVEEGRCSVIPRPRGGWVLGAYLCELPLCRVSTISPVCPALGGEGMEAPTLWRLVGEIGGSSGAALRVPRTWAASCCPSRSAEFTHQPPPVRSLHPLSAQGLRWLLGARATKIDGRPRAERSDGGGERERGGGRLRPPGLVAQAARAEAAQAGPRHHAPERAARPATPILTLTPRCRLRSCSLSTGIPNRSMISRYCHSSPRAPTTAGSLSSSPPASPRSGFPAGMRAAAAGRRSSRTSLMCSSCAISSIGWRGIIALMPGAFSRAASPMGACSRTGSRARSRIALRRSGPFRGRSR